MAQRELAGISSRVVAKAIDLLVMVACGIILPRVIGPLIGFAYSLLADALTVGELKNQSLGKRALGIRVVRLSGDKLNFRDSAIRNAPIGVATFFGIIPIWGWVILAVLGIPLFALELYLLMRAERHRRLGDVMAETEVVLDPAVEPWIKLS